MTVDESIDRAKDSGFQDRINETYEDAYLLRFGSYNWNPEDRYLNQLVQV